MVADAKKLYGQGFRAVKVKAGVHPDKDIEVCKLIHEACGPDMKINLDPYMLYSRENALRVGMELDGILDSFEEPLLVCL
ncbi:enolase C-terminal domain-like protein [Psychrobacillus sp. OK032]|uniref:enolase C-terminal domain-like protein n=1 Tax=Psychrobacillus sp. OK032 TaxID=1884358 RepID=UPI00210188E5|nr:enolase C-terminal domain-like protein [Psychrobacillus sp. OK032]